MIDALPVAQCGRIIRNDLSAEAHSDTMSRMAARLNAPALKEYYDDPVARRAAGGEPECRAAVAGPVRPGDARGSTGRWTC